MKIVDWAFRPKKINKSTIPIFNKII